MVNWLNSMFHKILLLIDAAVYWFVSMCYQLFVRMATLQLFNDAFFEDFANRIYAILGVFMLFYLAYALLNALIDPEKLTGDKGVSKIASNLVISLVLLGLTPTIFDYAYRLQNYILSSNILGAIILDKSTTDVNSGQEAMVKFGDSFSFTVMNTFINPDNYNVKMSNGYNWFDYKKDVLENSDYMNLPALSEAIVDEQVDLSSGEDVQVTYYVLISTAAGVFMCYMILSFTIDLGVRVFKFAFCQLLAPIPIIMRAMPGKKGVFDKWLKLTLTVFFEVFVRVAVMYLAVYFIRSIYLNWRMENFSGIQGKLALAIIIMGIFAFAKQAPKMLSDILGMDSGNLKLGIGDKLRAGGALAGSAMLGAGMTGLVQNTVRGLKTGKGLMGSVASAAAGATSSMFNAYRNGAKDAKNFGDVKKAAAAGAQASAANRERRAAYRASHESAFVRDELGFPRAAGPLGTAAGHISDAIFGIGQWAGVELSTESLQKQVAKYDKGTNFKTQLEDIAKKKDNYIKALVGQLDAIEKKAIERSDYETSRTVQRYNQNTGTWENVTESVFDETGYQKAIKERADQIADLKNRRDIAMAKWVNDKLNDKDDAEVEAVRNAFNTYVRENASDASIRDMKLEGIEWNDAWNTFDDNGNPINLSDEQISGILKDVKAGTSYLQNHKTLKEKKEEATKNLNERIIKEQQKKN